MKVSVNGINLIKHYEGCKLKAYLCPAGVPTIGYGATYYPNKSPVKIGDVISQVEADVLLTNTLGPFEMGVTKLLTTSINQNQFDALVSFAYNLGLANLKSSTLLKKVNANPSDSSIPAEFAKWCKAGGKVLAGLVARRQAEAELYKK